MNKTLLILAAGLGSRYGGGKQTDKFGPDAKMLMEYAIDDAVKHGFDKAVVVISPSMKDWFVDDLTQRVNNIPLAFAVQDNSTLPSEFTPPAERTRPYGTVHAIVCAQKYLTTPFAVINADDFYGELAYKEMSEELESVDDNRLCMVAYPIDRTMSAYGMVTRGLCEIDDAGYLRSVEETYNIRQCEDGAIRSFDKSDMGEEIDGDTVASMNLFGFSPQFVQLCRSILSDFLLSLSADDLRSELPVSKVVDKLVRQKDVQMKVKVTASEWLGVTYQEDKERVNKRLFELYS